MKNIISLTLVSAMILGAFSCRVVRPGEIGIKQTLGRIQGNPYNPGSVVFNPFTSRVIIIDTRTVESFQTLPLPTKEGLSVSAEISLLYHVKPEAAAMIYQKFGTNYEEVIVLSNFRATAREISARYFAKDLYATERQKVEKAIADELKSHIEPFGFEVDAVLLKDIMLPQQIVHAIENKVQAEQDALKMDFVIQKQRKEAERQKIEAEGIRAAQEILNKSLNGQILEYNRIKMYEALMSSGNSKVIVTDGKTPVFMNTGTSFPEEKDVKKPN